jgi:hypothetical protein
VEIEGSPWSDLNRGREITTNTVARLLRKFDIAPRTIRVGGDTVKGYFRECFEDPWTRYLSPGPSTSAFPAVTPSQIAKTLSETPFSETSQEHDVTAQKSEEETVFEGFVTPVTVQAGVPASHTEKAFVAGEL